MRKHLFHLSHLTLAISSALITVGGFAHATEKLDMSFIQGGSSMDAAAWAALNSRYAPGRYLVDIQLNGKAVSKQVLDIAPEDSETLCLTPDWLKKAGIVINPDFFSEGYNAERQCYVLTAAPSAKVDFDVSTQSLSISLPQLGLLTEASDVDWDYGTSAFRVNYNVNANTGNNNSAGFGSAELKANLGRWVVSSSSSVTTGDSGNSASIAMFAASRAIQSLNADLVVGKTQVGDSLLGSVGTYGVTLTRNNSMKPGNVGYTPVFSGTAKGAARVTLTQGNNTLYSEMVPPGPFAISGVTLFSSGDITMTVTEGNGSVTTTIFPLTVIAGQLSPGQHEFSISAGLPDDDSSLDGGLMSASYGYGLSFFTLRAGTALHERYQGVTGGVVTGLGPLGALSLEGAYARARYRDTAQQDAEQNTVTQRRNREISAAGQTHTGSKIQVSWNKQLESTGTGLRVSWSRRLTEDFPDLSSFDPTQWRDTNRNSRFIRDEWNGGINQGFGGYFNAGISGWQRTYWNSNDLENGLTGTLGTQIKGISLNVNGTTSRSSSGQNNYSVSASVSVPFSLFEQRYSSSTTVSSSKGSGVGISTGISGNLNDRFSYGISAGRDSDGGTSTFMNANYSADRAIMGGSINQSDSGGTSGSLSLSGSVLAVPAARSVMFSRTTGDTVAVVGIKNTPGVRITSGNGQTDSSGNLVVPLNSYDWNSVTVDAGSLPLSTELNTTSRRVVPSGQAVVWMPFDTVKVHRYLLQVREADGKFVPGGTWAKDQKGTPLGFVAANGVLMLNVMDTPGKITLGGCTIPAGKLKETEKLQEIRCEKP